MGHAATATRASVLETASATLEAVGDVRSLANTLITEQVDLKARIAAIETRERELGAALELNLAAIRAKADTVVLAKRYGELEEQYEELRRKVQSSGLLLARHSDLLGRGFLGRLRWLVAGR